MHDTKFEFTTRLRFPFINGFVFLLVFWHDKLFLTHNIRNNLGAMLVKKRAKGPQATHLVNPDELAMPSGIFYSFCVYFHIFVCIFYIICTNIFTQFNKFNSSDFIGQHTQPIRFRPLNQWNSLIIILQESFHTMGYELLCCLALCLTFFIRKGKGNLCNKFFL